MISELTQSAINMFHDCAYQFEQRYIRGIIIPPGVAGRRGSSVHHGIEYDYKYACEHGFLAPLDEVTDASRDEFVRLVTDDGCYFTDDEVTDAKRILGESLDQAVAAVSTYHDYIAPQDKEIALIEERLYADLGFGIPVSGKPDVVADGRLIDVKTSGSRWAKGDENTEIQPTLYRILLRSNGYGDLPAEYRLLTNMKKGPKDKDAGVWDAERGVFGEIRPAARTDADEKALMARIEVMVKMIAAGLFPPAPCNSWRCSPKWCGYASRCPYAHGHKTI